MVFQDFKFDLDITKFRNLFFLFLVYSINYKSIIIQMAKQ